MLKNLLENLKMANEELEMIEERWNAFPENAEIEIIDTISHKEVAEYFQNKGDNMYPVLNREMWDWGEDHPSYLKIKGIQDFYFEKAAEIRGNINIGNIK